MNRSTLAEGRGGGLSEIEVADVVEAIERDADRIEMPEEWIREDPVTCTAHDVHELRAREVAAVSRFVELSPYQQVKAALRGNRRARAGIFARSDLLLLRLVALNPVFAEEEAVTVARSSRTSPEALRVLAENPVWSRFRTLRLALVENPRTPTATALRLLDGLSLNDLRALARNRNVPVVIATHARLAAERREVRLTQAASLTRAVSSRALRRRSCG